MVYCPANLTKGIVAVQFCDSAGFAWAAKRFDYGDVPLTIGVIFDLSLSCLVTPGDTVIDLWSWPP